MISLGKESGTFVPLSIFLLIFINILNYSKFVKLAKAMLQNMEFYI